MFPKARHLKPENSTYAIIMLILPSSVLLFEMLAVGYKPAYPIRQPQFLRK